MILQGDFTLSKKCPRLENMFIVRRHDPVKISGPQELHLLAIEGFEDYESILRQIRINRITSFLHKHIFCQNMRVTVESFAKTFRVKHFNCF